MKDKVNAAVDYIDPHISKTPSCGIILGTGLGSLAGEVEAEAVLPYDEIPHFPASTVESHHGRLIYGTLEGVQVLVMQGRFHYYEGYGMKEVTFPVRVMYELGIRNLFISNAAGGLHADHQVSDLMILNDHINLLPEHPLRGRNEDSWGPRFPDMSEPYYRPWIDEGLRICQEHGIRAHQGTYAAVSGPTLETRAEYRYIASIGADAVGMSTVPENIVAIHMGMRCFAVSVITDLGVPGKIEHMTVEQVIAAARKAEPGLSTLIKSLLPKLSE